MRNSIKYSIIAMMLSILGVFGGLNADAQDAKASAFVEMIVSELKTEVEKGQAEEVQSRSLQNYLSEYLALDRMQRFIMSKRHLKTAEAEQAEEFNDIFGPYILTVFTDHVDNLVTRRLEYGNEVERKPGDYIVRSTIFDKENKPRAKVDWRVLEIDGELKLVDVMIEGSSLNLDYRAQFSEIMKKDGFESLLVHMRDVIQN